MAPRCRRPWLRVNAKRVNEAWTKKYCSRLQSTPFFLQEPVNSEMRLAKVWLFLIFCQFSASFVLEF